MGHAHLTTVEEFRTELAEFDHVVLWGAESFFNTHQAAWLSLPADAKDAWLFLVEQTAATPEALGMSDHFLFVGRKR